MEPSDKHILVVEDERVVAKDLQLSLTRLGYQVPVTAASAEEAIRLASEHCPDLVLMDIRIKGDVDGIETARLLRTRFDVPIIYLTAFANDETIERAKATEPYGYLLKPVKPDDIRSAIEIALYKHEMERRLRKRERWFSTTLRAIADAVIATDHAGDVTFMNLAAEILTGMRKEQGVGRRLGDILRIVDQRSRDAVENPILRVLATGQRSIEGSAAPIVDESGALPGAELVFREVSEQRRLQQQLAMADRLSSLGTLAAGVAHEINNPLTAVITCAGAIARLIELEGVAHPELGALAREIEEASERIRKIVADLILYARPSEERSQSVDVRDALAWALRMADGELRPRARVVSELAAVPKVDASEVRLGQVFLNLLHNAAQAIPEGAPEQHLVRVTTAVEGGWAVISVEDSGGGMAPEVVARIFDPFFTTRPIGNGSGLGLSVCNGIVRSIGGRIEVTSAVGRGSRFRVILPAGREATVEPAPPPPPAAPLARARILLIDDEPLMFRAIKRILGGAHEIDHIADSETAVHHLLTARPEPDLVLCDLMMPGVTGVDIYERILERAPALARRFAFVTGGAFSAKTEDFLASGVAPALAKPFNHLELRAFVDDLLVRRAATP